MSEGRQVIIGDKHLDEVYTQLLRQNITHELALWLTTFYGSMLELNRAHDSLKESLAHAWEAGAIAGISEAAGEAQAVNPYREPEPPPAQEASE